MLNWWLIVLIVVIPILCIGLAVYILFYFQSEEDKGTDFAPKVVFVVGIVLALGSVLLVPYDVANSPNPTVKNKYQQSLNTELMWQIVLWAMAAMAIVICPFFMFFYEAYDPDKPRVTKQIAHGIIMTLVILAVFAIITGVCFVYVGVATVDFENFATSPQRLTMTSTGIDFNSTFTKERMDIDVSVTTYAIGMLCFFGWILFFFYGGTGIISYPIMIFRAFKSRTKAINATRFTQEMAVVLAKADALLEICLQLQKTTRGRLSRSTRNKVNILRNEVYLLEAQEDQLIWAYTKAGGSPFIVYGKLFLGVVCLATAIVWCVHIFVYNTFDANLFLNTLLIELSNAFALCGIVAYGVLAFYLMWATFQGQIALGLRLVFFQIHPMKYHDTMVNSFLFNASLLLITAFAVLEFVARSFQSYAPFTAINALMNVYVLRLKGIGYFIRWAQFCFLGMTVLALLVLLICPRKKRRDPTKIRLDDLK